MGHLYKDRNFFQKLAPLWTVLVTVGYFAANWYAYFGAEDFSAVYYFDSYIVYAFWIVYELAFFMSFSANNLTEFVRHVLYYFIITVCCAGVFYYWIEEVFDPYNGSLYWKFIYNSNDSYHIDMYREIVLSALGLIFFGVLFCVVKYNKNTKGWIKKHTNSP